MGRPYTVLLVDDDAAVREVVGQSLSREGFFVVTAPDGYTARGVLTEHHVDLLLTDIVMPGMSGFEFAQQAKLIRPRLKILYITGYADKTLSGGAMRYGEVLHKPVRPDALVSEISHALSGIP
jgi:DNA-binding NtrC family response regulator